MQKIDGKLVHFKVDNEQLKEIDRIGKIIKCNRSETIRRLLDTGSSVFCEFEKFGLIQIAVIVRDTLKMIRKNRGQMEMFPKK